MALAMMVSCNLSSRARSLRRILSTMSLMRDFYPTMSLRTSQRPSSLPLVWAPTTSLWGRVETRWRHGLQSLLP